MKHFWERISRFFVHAALAIVAFLVMLLGLGHHSTPKTVSTRNTCATSDATSQAGRHGLSATSCRTATPVEPPTETPVPSTTEPTIPEAPAPTDGMVGMLGGHSAPPAPPPPAPTPPPPPPRPTPPPPPPRVQPNDPPPSGGLGELYQLTNQDRARNGMGALAYSDELARVAQQRANDLVNHRFFSHYDPGGAPGTKGTLCITEYFGAWGMKDWTWAGENIGWEDGAADWASTLDTAFMNSPEHKANILSTNYTRIGLGVATAPVTATYSDQNGNPFTVQAGSVFVSEVFANFR